MKRLLCLLLALTLCLSSVPVLAAQGTRDLTFETQLATQLKSLGLFLGTGQNADGSTNFELNREPTRLEAVVMLLRALGKATEAEATPKSHPFTDVPKWANGYVSYAYAQGLTKGVSATKFGSDDLAKAWMYLTFILRALGYVEGMDDDFMWYTPEALSSYAGILPLQVDTYNFLRADVVSITTAALYANLRGSETTLKDSLAEKGVFTSQAFQTVFPNDPFADFRALDAAVVKAIDSVAPLGLLPDNRYAIECHRILEQRENNGQLSLTVLISYSMAYLTEDNTNPSSSSIALWEIVLDAQTLAPIHCRTSEDIRAAGLELSDVFSANILSIRQAAREDMGAVSSMKRAFDQKNGKLVYTRPTYDSELAKAKASFSEVRQTLETPFCTVLFGSTTTGDQLSLVYPPSEESKAATSRTIKGYPGGTLRLYNEGQNLYYSYFFDNGKIPFSSHSYVRDIKAGTLPTSGTVHHFIDLKTGYAPSHVATGRTLIEDPNSAFEQAIQKANHGFLSRLLETPYCTLVISTPSGGPRSSTDWLNLIYKAGSPLGEGTTVFLPNPGPTATAIPSPKEFHLSEDGLTLRYQYDVQRDMTTVVGELTVKAGTYSYTVDLSTGKATEHYTAN